MEDGEYLMFPMDDIDPALDCGPSAMEETCDAQWDPRVVAYGLLTADAKLVFAENMFDIYRFWLQLVQQTTLSPGMTCVDHGITMAFQAIDNVIDREGHRLARLAYVRLPVVMSALQGIISTDRKQGRIRTSVGYRNASVALDIYLSAQHNSTDATRKNIAKRARLAARWAALGGNFPLLLLSYPNAIENIV